MHDLYRLKEMLVSELDNYGKKDLTMSTLDVVDKLAHAAKNVCKLIESSDEGYSKADGRYSSVYVRPDGSYRYDHTDGSYRGRDSMGRYSRSDDMRHELEKLMDKAPDDRTREEIRRLMDRM